jgi:phosphinothricin acetyltransferase
MGVASIRLAGNEDAAEIAAIYAPIVRDTTISFELEPPDEREIAQRMDAHRDLYPWLVCEIDGRVAGYAYASSFRSRAAYRASVETSVYVAETFRRCGVAGALYDVLLRELTLQRFHIAIGVIALPNDSSVALHERLGFEKVGVLHEAGWKSGAWRDVGIWERRLTEADSGEIRPVAAIVGEEEFRRVADAAARTVRGRNE